ncbi:hypothetical protein E1295_32215 [Nonomuraea mesophila]|uniref:Uncharacterized protein n=1 Tax=Nonomuraea mesophila TaxID=2530382 RepID=A0A4R5EY78_9ACTN|nr:hypothetical protein [Nonomuraea mesophila]TDE39943.1 hypothetical protein E1295_32215 [Nonomuraea mesophila]
MEDPTPDAIRERQRAVTAVLLALLDRPLPVLHWSTSAVDGTTSGQADNIAEVRAWADVISHGTASKARHGDYLEAHGVDEFEGIRVWAPMPKRAERGDAA